MVVFGELLAAAIDSDFVLNHADLHLSGDSEIAGETTLKLPRARYRTPLALL